MNVTPVIPRSTQTLTRVGVIGGGQLAWMMGGAARDLGLSLIVQTPHGSDPAVPLAVDTVLAEIEDAGATAELAKRCDVITFENEFIDLDALSVLAESGVCFRPRLEALAPLLDKFDQCRQLRDLGIPVPRFEALTRPEGDPTPKIDHSLGYPVVLKARRHGYDGQGTFIIPDAETLAQTWAKFGYPPMLLQEFVPFERELAAIAARSVAGDVAVFPIVETVQQDQVCHRVIAPANIAADGAEKMDAIARTLLKGLDVVGVFGIEFFLTADGRILVNEIAPRTHNSGHFSLDACETSQFEQHLRAVCGLPLGNPSLKCGGAVMVNLLGYEFAESDYLEKRERLAAMPQAKVHWYGKTESRPGRKLGHMTVLLDADNPDARQAQAEAIARRVEAIWYGN
ncbi:MAG: 5-(carboxyamino)imidazole ribonucleotide synthase [Limnospira sp.]